MSVAKSGLKTWLRVEGVISDELKERGTFLASALRKAVDKSSTQLKEELRLQVRRAGLGERLEKAWQSTIYPKNSGKMTFGPAAVVYSKSTILHRAFNENRTISAGRAQYLVVALPAAIHLGLGYSTISRNGTKVPAGQRRKVSEIDAAAKKLRAVVVSAHNTKRGRVLPKLSQRGAMRQSKAAGLSS
jgi:Flp pilus assembly protein TadB